MRATTLFLTSSLACLQALAATESDPILIVPDIITSAANEASPAFAPDGRTVYFTRNNGNDYDILVSEHHSAGWSMPVPAPFSGQWRDLEATVAPDGSYLIFASSRPLPGASAPPDGFWSGINHPGKGGNLWRVDRINRGGWSDPVRLPDLVNRNTSTFSPAVAADGTLYFMEVYGESQRFHLFRSEMRGGVYQPPEPMPFTSSDWSDVDPAVAPDESFLIFSSTRPPAPPQTQDLFIVFRSNGAWGEPRHLPERINRWRPIIEARLSPDAHTLYFTSSFVQSVHFPKDAAATRKGLRDMQSWNNGNGHIWQVDISDVLQSGPVGDKPAGAMPQCPRRIFTDPTAVPGCLHNVHQ